MPAFYTDIAPVDLTLNVRNRIDGDLVTGNVVYAQATYTATGTEAATGDTIEVAVLPVGAIPLPELWRVNNEASMGGSVLALPTIGDASDVDRYSATSISINSSTAGSTAVTPAVATSVLPRFVITEATQRVVAAFTRTNAMTAGKKISFLLAFRMP
jgi:carbohydrate-binding DOMON domain-containing protein